MVLTAFLVSIVAAHAKGKKGGHQGWPGAHYQAASYGAIEGKLDRYLLNPHGEIDGFLLDNGAEVKWPAHLGEELASNFQPGAPVRVTGFPDRKGNFKVYQIQGAGGGPVLQNTPPAFPAPKLPGFVRDAVLQALAVEGKITRVLPGRNGEPRLLLLDSGAQVHVPRHAAWMVARLAAQPVSLKAEGYGRRTPHGVVLRATVLTPAGEAPVPLYAQPVR